MFAAKTSVPVDKTRVEIERLVMKHKAVQYGTAVDHAIGQARVQFKLYDRVVRFTLALPDGKKFKGDRLAQMERSLWRALLLVVKAKLEAVESGITTFEQEFLAHIVLPNDRTVADIVVPLVGEAYGTGTMPRLLAAGDDNG